MHKRILLAPLDWGLGHTTRCVPLIRYIRALGHVPVVAGNTSQLSFIKTIFNNIETVHLDGYNITYSKWNRFAQAGLLLQLPAIRHVIKAEHKWLHEHAEKLQIDGIISDNRYGLYHDKIPSVIMTHQLQVLSGFGPIVDRVVQRIHYGFFNHFGNVWVVDSVGFRNLAGQLSHPVELPSRTHFIGLLSRFQPMPNAATDSSDIVILLSGPEPQRGELSAMLWRQALQIDRNVVFIEGSEHAVKPAGIPGHITWYSRVADEQLAPILQRADMVVCRSGYSTLMDLVAMNRKAILIPTPGQTEQEYLAKHLHAEGVFCSKLQKGFDLAKAITESQTFPYKQLSLRDQYNAYQEVLRNWLENL